MKVSKQVTLNLGNYESLKVGVEEVTSFQEADHVIVDELRRLGVPISEKVKRCLGWQTGLNDWM